jgi:hypothetical protein
MSWLKYTKTIIFTIFMGVKSGRSMDLRVLENRVLRRIFGPKWKNCTVRSFIIYTRLPSIIREIKSRRME